MGHSQSLMQRFDFLFPRFLKEDYSPYRCKVSPNRENYNLRARRIHLQNLLKTWINTGQNPFIKPVECNNCLFDSRIPNIYIGPDGLCNMCMTYKKNYKQEILVKELEIFRQTPKDNRARLDAVVAFSGGKDSAAALYLARERLGLDVIAVLVDNGFIPPKVIDNGLSFCDKLEVDLVVLKIELAPYIKKMMDEDFKKGYPCYKCTEMFHREIQKYCVANRINRVILGRNWWRWLEPEVRSVRWVKDEKSRFDMQFISLPFALQLTEKSVLSMLEKVGWLPVKIYGNSSNCLIPGLVEYPIYQRIGYHPELNLLSREVIAGFLEKQEAKERLREIKNNIPILRELLNKRLEE